MAIITLTTDLGLRDHYVAVLKGSILSKSPLSTLVDISHEIAPFDIQQASFVIKNAWHYFPQKTIHIVNVHAENKASLKCVAIAYKQHFFIGLDNGLFSLIFEDYPDKIIELARSSEAAFYLAKDVLAEAASALANGTEIQMLGKLLSSIETKTFLRPPDNEFIMKGNVVYVDRFGNAMINITKDRFEKIRAGRDFSINFKKNDEFHEISNTYSDVPEGEKLCLFNSAGYLEIAIHKGNASELLGLHVDDTIQIEFE